MASEEPELTTPIVCLLKKYEPVPFMLADRFPAPPAKTPSEWFSKKWPREAELYGTPFLETTYTTEYQLQHVNPIALNEVFFASILAGDKTLGHKVVFYTPDQEFYFKDPAEGGKFKPTTEDKLKTLLSLYILKCAEELNDSTPKFNLFIRFRKDQELQNIIIKARSLLAVDKSFFAVDSPNVRVEGAEIHGKAARIFVCNLMEMIPGQNLTVTESYIAFREYCVKNGLVLVDRRLFQDLIVEIVQKEFGLALRHDVPNEVGKHQRGWKGIGLRDVGLMNLEPQSDVLTGN